MTGPIRMGRMPQDIKTVCGQILNAGNSVVQTTAGISTLDRLESRVSTTRNEAGRA